MNERAEMIFVESHKFLGQKLKRFWDIIPPPQDRVKRNCEESLTHKVNHEIFMRRSFIYFRYFFFFSFSYIFPFLSFSIFFWKILAKSVTKVTRTCCINKYKLGYKRYMRHLKVKPGLYEGFQVKSREIFSRLCGSHWVL